MTHDDELAKRWQVSMRGVFYFVTSAAIALWRWRVGDWPGASVTDRVVEAVAIGVIALCLILMIPGLWGEASRFVATRNKELWPQEKESQNSQ